MQKPLEKRKNDEGSREREKEGERASVSAQRERTCSPLHRGALVPDFK